MLEIVTVKDKISITRDGKSNGFPLSYFKYDKGSGRAFSLKAIIGREEYTSEYGKATVDGVVVTFENVDELFRSLFFLDVDSPLIPLLPSDIRPDRMFLSKDEDGHVIWRDMTIDSPMTIYVDNDNTDDVSLQDGTINSPYSSLQNAINIAPFGSSIVTSDGIYNEDITINNKSNITINAVGVKGQYRVIINSLTISGNSQRLGLQNIQCNGDYNYTSTGSLIYIDNLAVRGATNLSSGGYHRYDDCFFFNVNVIGSTFADFRNCQCEDNSTWLLNGASATLSAIGCLNAKYVHNNGVLALSNGTNVLPVGDNVGIESTANSGLLFLGDGITLIQANGQYASINKTGLCPCIFGLFPYNPMNSTLSGTITYSKLQAHQVDIDGSGFSSKSGFLIRWNVTGLNASIGNGSSYNLTQHLVGLLPALAVGVTDLDFARINTGSNALLKFPSNEKLTSYIIDMRLTGAMSASSDRSFTIELRRSDNSLVKGDAFTKSGGSSLSSESNNILTYTNGVNDPYTLGGMKIILNNTSSSSISLTGFEIIIDGSIKRY